jgi:hypothetical protein
MRKDDIPPPPFEPTGAPSAPDHVAETDAVHDEAEAIQRATEIIEQRMRFMERIRKTLKLRRWTAPRIMRAAVDQLRRAVGFEPDTIDGARLWEIAQEVKEELLLAAEREDAYNPVEDTLDRFFRRHYEYDYRSLHMSAVQDARAASRHVKESRADLPTAEMLRRRRDSRETIF